MREVLEVNREGMIPLHSLPRLDFMFYLGFSLGQRPCTALLFSTLLTFVKSLDFVCIWHRGVPWFSWHFLDIVRSSVYTVGLASKFLSVWHFI